MSAKAKPVTPPIGPEDAIDPKKALVPAVLKVNAMRVQKGFWPKIVRTAAKIPFADHALSVWYAAKDPKTPMAARGIMLGALAYFVMPVDAIPDVFAGIGFTDDAAVFAAVLATLTAHIKPHHRQAAEAALQKLKAKKEG